VNSDELERQMERLLRELQRDLEDSVPAARVTAVGRAHYESLHRGAAINDYIPLLVYRFAKEELVASRRDELQDSA
jgi:hypothetical protein